MLVGDVYYYDLSKMPYREPVTVREYVELEKVGGLPTTVVETAVVVDFAEAKAERETKVEAVVTTPLKVVNGDAVVVIAEKPVKATVVFLDQYRRWRSQLFAFTQMGGNTLQDNNLSKAGVSQQSVKLDYVPPSPSVFTKRVGTAKSDPLVRGWQRDKKKASKSKQKGKASSSNKRTTTNLKVRLIGFELIRPGETSE